MIAHKAVVPEHIMRSRVASFFNGMFPVIVAFLIGSVFALIIGANPFKVYAYIVEKSFFSVSGIINTLGYATPMIITAIAMSFSFKSGIYNMGVEGQMLMGAFAAAYVGIYVPVNSAPLHVLLCILAGALVGLIYAIVPALLKAYLKISEVVVTIMLNNIATIITTYLANGPFSGHKLYTSTLDIQETAKIPRILPQYRLTYAVFIAVILLMIMWFVLRKTRFGYEINCVGKQWEFSDAMGMKVYRKTIVVFLIGGMLAGVAGAGEVCGVLHCFQPGFSGSPGLGYDGMLICILANQNPLSIFFVSILFGAFKYGSIKLQAGMGVPADLVDIIKCSMILLLSVRYIDSQTHFVQKLAKKLTHRADGKGGK